MDNLTTKLLVGNLEGKNNSSTWNYKICKALRSIPYALEIVDGKVTRPVLVEGARDQLASYTKAVCSALLLLISKMNDATLHKVMRYNIAREVWLELHRLFDGTSEDKSYNLCMSFFGFKRNPEDDIATHMCKLKKTVIRSKPS